MMISEISFPPNIQVEMPAAAGQAGQLQLLIRSLPGMDKLFEKREKGNKNRTL